MWSLIVTVCLAHMSRTVGETELYSWLCIFCQQYPCPSTIINVSFLSKNMIRGPVEKIMPTECFDSRRGLNLKNQFWGTVQLVYKDHQWDNGKLVFVHSWSLFRRSVSETHYINSIRFTTNRVFRHTLGYRIIITNIKIVSLHFIRFHHSMMSISPVKYVQTLLWRDLGSGQREVASIDRWNYIWF